VNPDGNRVAYPLRNHPAIPVRPTLDRGFSFMRRVKLLVPLLGIVVLVVALWLLGRELHGFRPAEFRAYLRSLPAWRIAAALALTALNYLVLTGYDALALRYVRQRVAYRRSTLASFIGYAFSMLLGHAVLTGGAVRYRLYTSWGVPAEAVARVIGFCGLAFWMGFLSLGAAVFIIDPLPLPGFPVGPRVLGCVMAAAFLGWLGLNAARSEPVRLGRWTVELPGGRSTLAQAAVASLDLALAASVLWVLLPPDAPLTFGHLLTAFLLAMIAGTLSMVPGGAGVFDGILVALVTPAVSPAAALGALVAYRAVYYLLPFAAAALTFGAVEVARHRHALARGAGSAWASWARPFAPRALAAAVFACGALVLFSGVLPGARGAAPPAAAEAAHVAAMAAGAAMLVVSRAMWLRRSAAYGVAAALLAAAAVAVLARGTDAWLPVLLGATLAALLPCRAGFDRRGALFAAPGWLVALAWVMVSAAWLGWQAHRGAADGFAGGRFAGDADASRFLRGMAAAVAVAFVSGVVLLLRGAPADEAEALPSAVPERARGRVRR
jgi:phosphatidylglycerol lysyltransferase